VFLRFLRFSVKWYHLGSPRWPFSPPATPCPETSHLTDIHPSRFFFSFPDLTDTVSVVSFDHFLLPSLPRFLGVSAVLIRLKTCFLFRMTFIKKPCWSLCPFLVVRHPRMTPPPLSLVLFVLSPPPLCFCGRTAPTLTNLPFYLFPREIQPRGAI